MYRMARNRRMDEEIREFLAEPPLASTTDVTQHLLQDSSQGPGEQPRLVASAKPATDVSRTPTLAAALQKLRATPDRTIGFISKPLAYGRLFRYLGKRDHANLIRLIKGGYAHVCEVKGPPPEGSNARVDSPYGDRYYVLHLGACGGGSRGS